MKKDDCREKRKFIYGRVEKAAAARVSESDAVQDRSWGNHDKREGEATACLAWEKKRL